MQYKFKLILFKAAMLSDLVFEISTSRNKYNNKYMNNQDMKLSCWVWFWTLNGKKAISPLRRASNSIDLYPLSVLKIKTPCGTHPSYPQQLVSSKPVAPKGDGAMALMLWLVKTCSQLVIYFKILSQLSFLVFSSCKFAVMNSKFSWVVLEIFYFIPWSPLCAQLLPVLQRLI